MNDEQSAVIFAGIFKQTIQNVLGRIKAWLGNSLDPYTPLLISIINSKSKEKFNQKGYDILDYYFDQVDYSVWPRFSEIYDALLKPLQQPEINKILSVEQEIGLDAYYAPLCTFIKGLTNCSTYSKNNQTINYRITRLLETISHFVEKISDLEKTPKEKKVGLVRRLTVIQKETQGQNALNEHDRYFLENLLENQINAIAEELLHSYYASLSDFAKKGKDAATNPDAQNLTLIENISKEFSDTWQSRLSNLRAECEARIGKNASTKKVLKRVIAGLMESYNVFFTCVKSSYPSFTQNMMPLHKLSIEMNKQASSIDN